MTDAANPLVRGAGAPSWALRHWVPLASPMLPGFVERVVDADTLIVWARTPLWDYPAYPTVRLAVVDAPESFHPRSLAEQQLAAKAVAFVRAAVEHKQVAVIPCAPWKDDRNRFIARLLFHDAKGNARDLGAALTAARLLKSDVPAFAAALEAKDAGVIAAWGLLA